MRDRKGSGRSGCVVIPFPSPTQRQADTEAVAQELADLAVREAVSSVPPGADINEVAKRLLLTALDRLEQDQKEGGPWVA
jgi:hypothetical protein